jgi:GTP-binding protein
MKFVDIAHIHVHGGDGGSGVISFRREKYVPKGGPDGGNGGRGGDVVLRANRHLATLLDFQYKNHYRAPAGGNGAGSRKTGKSGQSLIVEVPVGTVIRDTLSGDIIGDLVEDGQEIIAARGGRGGRGNAEFATPTNQAPRQYEPGEDGKQADIELELKLLADIGLVGLPNAGKSTLISVISAARPKIADYPFTTLVPNLGIVRLEAGKSFVVADIPGLIEGAHRGKGLGHQFLRHIERTRVLVFLLDCTRPDVKGDLAVLTHEIEQFNTQLAGKPRIVALTKIDAIDDASLKPLKSIRFGKVKPCLISAVAGKGVDSLVHLMWTTLHKIPDADTADKPPVRSVPVQRRRRSAPVQRRRRSARVQRRRRKT